MTWWADRVVLARYVRDLLAGELARLFPGMGAPAGVWDDGFDLRRDLGLDSLALQAAGTALGEALRLPEPEALLEDTTFGAWCGVAAAGLARDDATIVFRTSGSTGVPKACPHALAALLQEADALAGLLAGTRRIVTAVPAHHIYGFLFTILLPRALGAPVAALRDAGPPTAGDTVIGFPDYWANAARVLRDVPGGVTGVTSTAPCPPEVARAVRLAGVTRLVEVYGSSETAGVGWRGDPDAPFMLLPYWRRGDGETLVRTLPDGGEQAVTCQDRLQWSGETAFRPAGRVDEAVQVGGVNVFPSRVARVLMAHGDVDQAAVRPMRPDEGTRLKAYIVPRAGADAAALAGELAAWTARHLPAPERPAAYTFGPHLPRTSTGKAADWIIDAEG